MYDSAKALTRSIRPSPVLLLHFGASLVCLTLIWFHYERVILPVSLLLLLATVVLSGVHFKVADLLVWCAIYAVAPVWLGQPLKSFNANLALFVQLASFGSLYKLYNVAMVGLSCVCLSSSILLVLDWARWWQDYPIPMQAALCFGHCTVMLFSLRR